MSQPEWESKDLAINERGGRLDRHAERDVTLALNLLVHLGGNMRQTLSALAEEGLRVTHEQLRYWRDTGFPRRYMEIRAELAADQGERIAGDAMDRALKYGEAQDRYVEKALEKVDEVSPDRLAAAARDLARAAGENITGAQLLRDKPTQIVETRDTAELLDQLQRAGVISSDPRFAQSAAQSVSAEAVEVRAKRRRPNLKEIEPPSDAELEDEDLAARMAESL